MNNLFEETRAIIEQLRETVDTPKFSQILSDDRRYITKLRERLEYIQLATVLRWWLVTLNEELRKKFTECLIMLFEKGIFPTSFANNKPFTLGGFRLFSVRAVIAHIKRLEDVPDTVKDEMVNCYISFIRYVNDISYGWFARASREAIVCKMVPCAVEEALSFSDFRTFIEFLETANPRDALIARCIVQGTLRISEVLGLTLDQIDFQKGLVCLKRKAKSLCVEYEKDFMKELEEYIAHTAPQRKESRFVFVTKKSKPLTRSRLNASFAQASSIANIKRVTPETLRSTWMLLKQQGYTDTAIMASKSSRLARYKHSER
ncbi:MAG: site-specific integrase [Candidatus Babeliales bacterium]|jgi:integrase